MELEEIAHGDRISSGSDSKLISSSSKYSSLLATKDRDYLLSPTGNQVKVSDLEGKVIGLYFSANWYPPCRSFTQILVGVYEQIKSNESNFQVVFVSSDEDNDAFAEYRASMPWLAVPFFDLETKKALNRRFHIEGIPCLIILQPSNNSDDEDEILNDGVELIYRYGVRAFPFTKERLEVLRKEELEKHRNQTITNLLTTEDRDYILADSTAKHVPVASLKDKTIGLFFSAQWCLPGVQFTHKLISIYKKIKQTLHDKGEYEDFEVLLVSTDKDQTSFDSYRNTMPWLALPFGDIAIKNLTKHFDVQAIPCLVILGPDGKTLTKHGRNLINLYQENAYPFTVSKVESLEKQIEEEAKNLPRLEYHVGHRHELTLVSEGTGGGPFICCDCDEQGLGWAYQCIQCGYEVHPKCIRGMD